MERVLFLIFQLIVLIFSVMIHEISHGAMALKLGDDTAKRQGRLTLNPLKHIDPIGSVFLPLLMLLVQSPILIGWAKPVPYNPLKLKNPRQGGGLIAVAGPISNLVIAIVFGVLFRLLEPILNSGELVSSIVLFHIVIFINVLLAVFNLLPIPPLDGAGVLFSLLPRKYLFIQDFLTRYGFILLIIFIFSGFQLIAPIIYSLYSLIAGQTIF